MRRRPAAAVALASLVALAAGCGGGSTTVSRTTATEPAPTAPATVVVPGTTVAQDRIPPPDAVPGVRVGAVRQLGDAQAFVDALYRAGDTAKPAARMRLERAGYAGGVLRDQVGEDPSTGVALLRSYAVELRDEDAATTEVDDAIEEVRATSPTAEDVEVPDLPGARALRVEAHEGGITGFITFVTFAVGPYVYGIQGVSTSAPALPQTAIIGAARDLYERVTAAP